MTASGSVLGLQVSSTSPVFLAILAVHVSAALVAVLTGAGASISRKGSLAHRRCGRWYRGALIPTVLSAAALVAVRPAQDRPLLLLGTAAVVAAVLGRHPGRRGPAAAGDSRHAMAMVTSYLALLTAFYVDNGPHLPLWNRLPSLAFWLGPALIGLPLLGWSLRRRGRVRSRRDDGARVQ
jgi:uncharacterized membrane protein